MVIAVIIAGGVGARMGADIPKQFVQVNGKPILFYTLEAFQRHPMIDAIEVVCLDGWQDVVSAYQKEYGITKLKWMIKGGGSGQESIRNGVFYLEGKCQPNDIVVIHDGVRPLVDAEVLDDVIVKAQRYGNGVTSMPYNEQIFIVDPNSPWTTGAYIPRETLRRVATPQAYQFGLLDEKYHEAFDKKIGIYGSSYTNTMMADLGVRLHLAAGSDRNIIEIFKGILESRNEKTA